MQTCDVKKHKTSLLDLQFVSHRTHTNPNCYTAQAKEREKDDINVDQGGLEKQSCRRRTGSRLVDVHYYMHLR